MQKNECHDTVQVCQRGKTELNGIKKRNRASERGRSKDKNLDRLTGTLKRNVAEAGIASRLREKHSGTLFLCDVDDLSQINKQYGHLAGDQCLKQVAQILSYMIQPDDIFGRHGGDEFMIFMPDCVELQQAEEICRRMENRFRAGRKGRISLSVTVIWVLCRPGDTCRRLLKRAEEKLEGQKALYSPSRAQKGKDHYKKDVQQVQKELMEEIQKPGAYCQDYETFKSIYRFLERGIIRSGQKACVILITVVDEQGGSLLPGEKDVLMEQLGEEIGSALRIGDVYTRYSSSQYLSLVIDTTEGQADRIVDRIRNQFLAGKEGNDILIHHCYELQPARVGIRTG